MRRGDLVKVKMNESGWGISAPGRRVSGLVGVLMHDAEQPFKDCLVLFPEGVEEINRYWLEVIGTRALEDLRGPE